jgi:DegV family protein with EDD domain
MSRIAVVTDSTADLPAELTEQRNIHVTPLNVRIGDRTFEDRVTITPTEFMDLLVTSADFPTTSQPSVGRFYELYRELASDYDAIVSIHISSKLSGTHQSALMARDMIAGAVPIHVIDSLSASMGLGFQVLHATELIERGASPEDVERALAEFGTRVHVIFVVDTLEYLRRGGRIGRAAEIVGSILKLKPILRVQDGVVVPYARTRTRPRAIAGLVEFVAEFPRIDRVSLLYSAGTSDVDRVAARLDEHFPQEQLVYAEISPVLSAHLGPNAVGVVVVEGPADA